MKVRVKESAQHSLGVAFGFFNYARRRPGDVFTLPDQPRRALFPGEQKIVQRDADVKAEYDAIKDKDGNVPQEYSFRWMEPVDEKTPDRLTTAQPTITAKNDELKGAKRADAMADKGVI
jgi:hypothetical protein